MKHQVQISVSSFSLRIERAGTSLRDLTARPTEISKPPLVISPLKTERFRHHSIASRSPVLEETRIAS